MRKIGGDEENPTDGLSIYSTIFSDVIGPTCLK